MCATVSNRCPGGPYTASSIVIEGQQLLVEDTITVTSQGHELINPALPYEPAALEKAIRKRVRPNLSPA